MRGTIADIWAEEVLIPTSRPFDGFVEYTKRVSPTCLVHSELICVSEFSDHHKGRKAAAFHPNKISLLSRFIFSAARSATPRAIFDRWSKALLVDRAPFGQQ